MWLVVLGFLSAPAPAPPAPPRALIAEAEAISASDPERAAALLEKAAIAAGADGALRLEALSARCWLLAVVSPSEAIRTAEAAMAEARRLHLERSIVDLRVCRGYAHERSDRLDDAARDYQFGVEEGARLSEPKATAMALVLRGELRHGRGLYGPALEDLVAAHRLEVQLGRRPKQSYALNAIANVYADRNVGDYARALEYYRQLLATHLADGRAAEAATAHFNIGSTLETIGELGAALDAYKASRKISVELHASSEIAYVDRSIGILLTRMGRAAAALVPLRNALAAFRAADDHDMVAATRLSLGVTFSRLGRLDAALAELRAAQAHYEAPPNDRFLDRIYEELAVVEATQGNWRAAHEAQGRLLETRRRLAESLQAEHTARLRVQFDSEKKEQENRALLQERALREQALRDAERISRWQQVSIGLGVAVLALLAHAVRRQARETGRMRDLAMTDALTRLANRRHFLALAEQAFDSARRLGAAFSVIVFDIDHFKRVNDTLGHEAGDKVLQRVAAAGRAALRPHDRMGRIGGEEFAVLLPVTRLAEATAIAERLRGTVAGHEFDDLAPGTRVSSSFGVAEWRREDSTLAALVRRADAALYRAKAGGRDRVEVEEPAGPGA
ncbi:MAG: diguanylate cyclase [Vicinamibacteria bacterium]|nr:diguanylate cyclase [Vicinamibacteria bacterium]